ncbi:MAG TPA: hypothetical protein PLD49_02475 [Thermoclostridium caenicola]|uniref:Uncharacterized protein n=1 Tax=Thermoclostridium caenicola TaxID=659425 RepID=A0A1M6FBU7_9FIRM|nr:hypothetical protein [Thermoclostridium caenicola]SHI95145.1 hypothetical protein SAMN05444373_101617 [Thermoclostridium caenicola]HOK42518.1 hypothetical protein [Thermoclostridium caenicola]HOL84824.1 hypothetical protein [Thermoclostridium caenicola]HPO76582.1 hypothetical protein [Thermoclostridium caenicola]
MFYLSFQNQIQLLLLLVFSSYVFLSGLSVGPKDPRLKAMALSFAIPLILGSYSFLAGPHNIHIASLYLDLSWFLLILALTLVSLIRSSSDFLRFLHPLLILLPMAAIFMQAMLLELDCRFYMWYFTLALAAIQLLLTIARLVGRNHSRLMLHLGVFLMTLSFALSLSDILIPPLIHGSAAAGLSLCALYFYMHTYGRLKAEHNRKIQAPERQ